MKKYKIVYENNGELKGNYFGKPNSQDTGIIERAVLEGSKPLPPAPKPQPQPTGTITITENGNYDVKEYATADVNVPTPGPDTSLLPDFFVPFMDMGEDGVYNLLEFIQLTAELGYEGLCSFLAALKFKAKFPLSEETRDQLEDVVIYSVEADYANMVADIYYYPIKEPNNKYYTSVTVETDAETGVSCYIFGEVVKEEE